MDVYSYEKYVIGELCFVCHVATHKSSAKQRQCPRCRRKWSFERRRLEWKLLEAFCLGASAHHASRMLECSYKTAYHAYRRFRSVVGDLALEERRTLWGRIELDESYFGGKRKGNRGRGAAGKVAVFGLLERDRQVLALVVPDVSKETLMAKIKAHCLKGAVYFTDEWKSYHDLKAYGKHLPITHSSTFARGRTHINGIEGFWSFAKSLHHKFHGVRLENFPDYLLEYEFRYNHRNEHLITLLGNAFLRQNPLYPINLSPPNPP